MLPRTRLLLTRSGVVIALAVAYFIAYPEDLASVERVLAFFQAIPTGLYSLLIALVGARAVTTTMRIWASRGIAAPGANGKPAG